MIVSRSVMPLVLALGAAAVLTGPVFAQATSGQVSGIVTDTAGIPLPGVQVSSDGSARTVITSQDGRYLLGGIAAGQRSMHARRLGFRAHSTTVMVAAGQTATLNFRLEHVASELEKVVSTGYRSQTKASITGATEVIGGEEIAKRPVANISKSLQGSVPGVTIQDFGGRPGGDGATVRIRGIGTLGNNGALILVDGVPGDLNNIDPLDIESVSVLKDAASAAIYGARAANGVILLKTRRGKNTGSLKFTYDGYYATQSADEMPQRVDIGTELRVVNEVYTNSGQKAKYSPGFIDSTVRQLDPINYPNTNWLNQIFQSAPMTSQTVRVSGGNDLANLSLSINSFNQEGILTVDTYYRRLAIRANSDFNISKRLTATADLVLWKEDTRVARGEGDAYFRAIHDTPPTIPATYSDGSYGWSPASFNPVAFLRENGTNNSRWLFGSINTGVTYQIASGLRIRGFATADNKDNRNLDFTPAVRLTDHNNPSIVRLERIRNTSTDSRNTDSNLEYQGTIEYEKSFGGHSVHLLGGYDQRESNHDDAFSQRQGAYNNDLQLPGSGDVTYQATGGGANTSRLRGYFARANYDWQGKYLLEANVRRDGSSRFGPGRKYGVFPSVSAAWRVSDESFFRRGFGAITDLKVRGSWGRLGNDRIGDYLYQQTINLNSGNYNFGNTLVTGATPGRIGNRDIGWETTEQTDVGVDLTMFDGRLAFTGDLYWKYTSGILQSPAISTLIGLGAPTTNAAEVSNKGWETAVTWRDQVRDLTYSVNFNLSDLRNRVEKLEGGAQLGGTIRRVGDPIDAYFGVQAVGIFKTQAEVDAWARQVPGKTGPGDLKYKDQNGDGKIDNNDRVVIGSNIPHYTLGSTLTAQYKRFDLSVLFQGVLKVDAYLEGALIEGPTWENFFPTYLLDYWRPDNLNAKWPRFVARSDHNHNSPGRNSWWVRDASYVKLKNLNFGYTVPPSLSSRIRLTNARLYLSATNLYTWSQLKGLLDPEFPTGRATYYYQTRNVSLGASFGM